MATKTKDETLKVELVEQPKRNPHEGKFPKWNEVDSRPKRRYRFSNLQQPGTELEASTGITVIKNTGRLGTHYEHYKIQDDEEVELPIDIVEKWKGLTYFEDGRKRPRFSFVEV